MILFQIEDYTTGQIVEEIKYSNNALRIARVNYEFEEQSILTEKIAVLSNELDRRRSDPCYHQLQLGKV
jgi:hypothetical protein